MNFLLVYYLLTSLYIQACLSLLFILSIYSQIYCKERVLQSELLSVTITVIIYRLVLPNLFAPPPIQESPLLYNDLRRHMFIFLYCICDASPIVLVALALYPYLNIYLKMSQVFSLNTTDVLWILVNVALAFWYKLCKSF